MAEVGDTIKVVFKKQRAVLPFSMHAHGLKYDEASAGVEPVQTGVTFTYHWGSRPGCRAAARRAKLKLWLYHSHVNEQRDVAAGLL